MQLYVDHQANGKISLQFPSLNHLFLIYRGQGGLPGAPGLPGLAGKDGMPGLPGAKGERAIGQTGTQIQHSFIDDHYFARLI